MLEAGAWCSRRSVVSCLRKQITGRTYVRFRRARGLAYGLIVVLIHAQYGDPVLTWVSSCAHTGVVPAVGVGHDERTMKVTEFVDSQQFREVCEALVNVNYDGSASCQFTHDNVAYSARFITDVDDCFDLNDWDCYGRVQWAGRGGRSDRPAGFDGAARKLWTRNDCFWWQPPADLVNNNLALAELLPKVRDILEYGFRVWKVEVDRRCSCCGSYTMIGSYSFGGYEPFEEPYTAVVGELLELAWDEARDWGQVPA